MPVEAVFGATAFAAMFLGWVVVPSLIKKRHSAKVKQETEIGYH